MNKVFINICVFAFGTVIGSFLNVCIHRMPLNQSIVFPSSHCPKCNKSLRWYHNIPVISYIILSGRCAFCREKISARYPAVELLTATLLTVLFTAFGPGTKFIIYSVFASALVVATFIDIAINEIPDEISVGGLVLGLAASALFPSLFNTDSRLAGFAASLSGAAVGGGLIFAMGAIGKIVFKKEAMGFGDVKLMAMIGSVVGWKLALFTFFLAPLFGASVGLVLKIKDGRETIAYGPYLSLASVIAVLYGDRLLGMMFYY